MNNVYHINISWCSYPAKMIDEFGSQWKMASSVIPKLDKSFWSQKGLGMLLFPPHETGFDFHYDIRAAEDIEMSNMAIELEFCQVFDQY